MSDKLRPADEIFQLFILSKMTAQKIGAETGLPGNQIKLFIKGQNRAMLSIDDLVLLRDYLTGVIEKRVTARKKATAQ